MMRFLTGRLLPGILLVLTAFWAGSQKNPTMGLFSFLPFFVMGVLIILRGIEELKTGSKSGDSDEQ